MNFIFLLCGCVILNLLKSMYDDWRFMVMQRKEYNKEKRVWQQHKMSGPEYEMFLSELDTILNLKGISLEEDHELD